MTCFGSDHLQTMHILFWRKKMMSVLIKSDNDSKSAWQTSILHFCLPKNCSIMWNLQDTCTSFKVKDTTYPVNLVHPIVLEFVLVCHNACTVCIKCYLMLYWDKVRKTSTLNAQLKAIFLLKTTIFFHNKT